ncbi:hypothetical protein QQP08_016807 [Theobroma cacao]|uniref:Transmembrane protein n=1 Tax=Theobroma cacao TaxID=3641 RepID=A0A061ETB7_THECC|nr:Uncharacterized protein TCM_022617 [Theobroma cacao]WRX24320.1 hypothetical protein QQP08_016807 [Theobroma cacao]
MADGISDASGETFPAADINGELNPGENKDFKVDSVSFEIATSQEIKDRVEAQEKKEKKDSMQTLKTAILVSAVVVAVAGAAFAITKKLKEK